jgi:hypothetical protein
MCESPSQASRIPGIEIPGLPGLKSWETREPICHKHNAGQFPFDYKEKNMNFPQSVNLPKAYTPRFPSQCVVCGKDAPDDTYRVTTRSLNSGASATAAGPKFSAEAPACRGCCAQMRRQVLGRTVANIVFIVAGVGVGILVAGGHNPLRHMIVFAVALVCLLPLLVWRLFYALPFDITAFTDKGTVDYEFRDHAYAQEFESLNEDAAQEPCPS